METGCPVDSISALEKSGFPRTHTGILKVAFLAHVMTRVMRVEKVGLW